MHPAFEPKKVVREGIVNNGDVVRVCVRYYGSVSFVQLICMLSCLSPHFFELFKKLLGTVHDTTMDSMCHLQPYCVLKMKCSVSHGSSIA